MPDARAVTKGPRPADAPGGGAPNAHAPTGDAPAAGVVPAAAAAGPAADAAPAAAADAPAAPRTRDLAGRLPAAHLPAWRRTLRYYISRLVARVLVHAYLRVRVEGRERLPKGPAVYCFNHLSWTDPFILMAALPLRPRLFFFGPKEEDMAAGGRNRLISWTGSAVPYKPGKNDLLGATRRVEAVFGVGGVLAIAGEGRIHVGESRIDPLSDGPAYFAIRAGVPIVPVAINGTSWIAFGRRVRVGIGDPILVRERPSATAVSALTRQLQGALEALVAGAPEPQEPSGRLGRWLSERFNDWGPGGRPTPSGTDSGGRDGA